MVAILSDIGVDAEDLEMVRAGTLLEVGNIVLNGVMGSAGRMKQVRAFSNSDVQRDDMTIFGFQVLGKNPAGPVGGAPKT